MARAHRVLARPAPATPAPWSIDPSVCSVGCDCARLLVHTQAAPHLRPHSAHLSPYRPAQFNAVLAPELFCSLLLARSPLPPDSSAAIFLEAATVLIARAADFSTAQCETVQLRNSHGGRRGWPVSRGRILNWQAGCCCKRCLDRVGEERWIQARGRTRSMARTGGSNECARGGG